MHSHAACGVVVDWGKCPALIEWQCCSSIQLLADAENALLARSTGNPVDAADAGPLVLHLAGRARASVKHAHLIIPASNQVRGSPTAEAGAVELLEAGRASAGAHGAGEGGRAGIAA